MRNDNNVCERTGVSTYISRERKTKKKKGWEIAAHPFYNFPGLGEEPPPSPALLREGGSVRRTSSPLTVPLISFVFVLRLSDVEGRTRTNFFEGVKGRTLALNNKVKILFCTFRYLLGGRFLPTPLLELKIRFS